MRVQFGEGGLRSVWLLSSMATLLLITACGDGGESGSGEIFGSWCGQSVDRAPDCQGDEIAYVELRASETSAFGGVHCEAYQRECYDLIDTQRAAATIRYAYEFDVFRVDAELRLDSRGEVLQGELRSSKCNGCKIPVTLHRIND
jgi:hypothetical protein